MSAHPELKADEASAPPYGRVDTVLSRFYRRVSMFNPFSYLGASQRLMAERLARPDRGMQTAAG
jgi:hypothetical protein